MSKIVCATRGGEGSRAVQQAAIRRAQDSGVPLAFLYVASPDSFHEEDERVRESIRRELNWLGETLLRIAQKRARGAGVEAETVLREGLVAQEIGKYLAESSATVLLVGAPRAVTDNVFGDDAIERFAAAIEAETDVPVEIVRPEQRP